MADVQAAMARGGGGGGGAGLGGGMLDPAAAGYMGLGFPQGPMDAAGDGAPRGAGGPGGDADAALAQLAELAAGGEIPVLMGRDGRPVAGPHGEPVFVGPGGTPVVLDARSGRLVPLEGGGGAQ